MRPMSSIFFITFIPSLPYIIIIQKIFKKIKRPGALSCAKSLKNAKKVEKTAIFFVKIAVFRYKSDESLFFVSS